MAEQVEARWLKDKFEDDAVLLDDDSVWEISPPDRATVCRWVRFSSITVNLKVDRPAEYCYVLTNSSYGESVAAKVIDDVSETILQRRGA